MSVSATFAADFSSFESAIARASIKMRGLDADAKFVERGLSRMGDSFSGRKLIQDATLASEAIARMGKEGGVSAGLLQLTDKELQRVGAQATEAAEKMSRMGVDVPAKMQAIVDAVKPLPEKLTLASKAANIAESSFGRMFSAFTAANLVDRAVGAIGNLIRSAIDFGKEAVTAAGKTADLADKLGLSTTAIQRMEAVASETGATVDDFASAAFKLGTRLSGGSGSVTDAVKDLGLSFQQLKALSPEQQFDKVVESLGKVDNATKRNTLGVALFGKSFEGIAAGVAGDYKKIADAAGVASEAQIRALDAAGDAWERFKTRAQRATQDVLGTLVIAASELAKSDFLTNVDRLLKLGAGGSVGVTGLASIIAETNAAAAEAQRSKSKGATGPNLITPIPPNYIEELKKIDAEVNKLTASQRAQIDAAIKLGESHERLADKMGMDEDVLKRYVSAQKEGTKAAKDHAAELKKLTEEQKEFAEALADALASLRTGGSDINTLLDTLEKQTGIKAVVSDVESAANAFNTLIDRITVARAGLDDFGRISAKPVSMSLTRALMEPFPKEKGPVGFGASLQGAFGSLPDVILGAIQGGGDIKRSIGSLLGGQVFGKDTGLNKSITSGISGLFGDKIGKFASSLLPGIGALIGPAITGLSKVFGGLLKTEGKKTNRERDAAISEFTGISGDKGASQAKFREMAAAAGIASSELDKLFSTKKTKDFESAMDSITRKIGTFTSEQEADQERLTRAIEKYGFTLEQLGPAFQKKSLDSQAKELIEDWRVLIDAGVEITTVNAGMADAINEYLQTAVKLGQEVPNAFKPILQKMIEQGSLTDEAGNAITDMEAAGIHFSETMTEGFDKVVKKLDELIQKLGLAAEGLGGLSVPSSIIDPNRYSQDDLGAIPMAGGGRGRVTQPTLFLAGERGSEDFAFSGGGKGFSQGDVVSAIQGLDTRLAAFMRVMPIALRDAVLLAR